jgi:hypothetical protein
MSYLADTELLSSALLPMAFSALIILLAFRGSARQALAVAAAERSAPKPARPAAARPAPAKSAPGLPPNQPRPKGFRSDDV